MHVLETWLLSLDRNQELTHIDPDMDIVENGLIDSLEFINFLYTIEEERGAEIPASILQLEKFKTLNSIVTHFF
jgi:acyl carrier protein